MVFLCRQSKGVHTVEEMQLLRDHADYLEKKVMKYEQETQALRSDLDMLVCLHTTYTRVCSSACACAASEHTKMCTFNVLCNVYSIRYIDIFISLF